MAACGILYSGGCAATLWSILTKVSEYDSLKLAALWSVAEIPPDICLTRTPTLRCLPSRTDG